MRLADAMSAILRQPIVVENKAGAAGNLGAQAAARAAPDGYTWVYAASTMAAACTCTASRATTC